MLFGRSSGRAVISSEVIDIFTAAGLKMPNVGILSDEFLEDVRRLKQKNLAVELLQRFLNGEIKSRFATNVVQQNRFGSCCKDRSSAIETVASKRLR
jgi:type I restriction enzyme R subunit